MSFLPQRSDMKKVLRAKRDFCCGKSVGCADAMAHQVSKRD